MEFRAYSSKGVDKNGATCNVGFGRKTEISPTWRAYISVGVFKPMFVVGVWGSTNVGQSGVKSHVFKIPRSVRSGWGTGQKGILGGECRGEDLSRGRWTSYHQHSGARS